MNIRKAALALATASSVALAGTAVAGAETPSTDTPKGVTLSSNIGHKLEKLDPLTGGQFFKPSKDKPLNAWGTLLWAGLAAGIAGTVASAIIGVGNYLKHQGIIK
ncbi:hypothetical protein ACN4D1_09050 [Corynebacterium macclintockiae]|uniref:hypothetical protein n=1 Tax=Corynebacterium macclintockiae TaxID=2913501 RepID=UPI003EBC9DDC